MNRLSQSRSSNFCPELRKNALLISQSHFSNFALHVRILEIKSWCKIIKGIYVEIGATVTDLADVVLYKTPTEPDPEYVKQDLAWADIAETTGSPEIQGIGIPTTIRSARRGEST